MRANSDCSWTASLQSSPSEGGPHGLLFNPGQCWECTGTSLIIHLRELKTTPRMQTRHHWGYFCYVGSNFIYTCLTSSSISWSYEYKLGTFSCIVSCLCNIKISSSLSLSFPIKIKKIIWQRESQCEREHGQGEWERADQRGRAGSLM